MKFNYKTSKDYETLFELMLKQRVIVFVEYKPNIVDVASTAVKPIIEYSDGDIDYNFSISSRGIEYFRSYGRNFEECKDSFIKQCKEFNVEFIEPQIKV